MNISPPLLYCIILAVFFLTGILLAVLKSWLLRDASRSLANKRQHLRRLAYLSVAAYCLILYGLYDGMLMSFIIVGWMLEYSVDVRWILGLAFTAALVISSLFWSYFSITTPIATALWLRRFHTKAPGLNLSRVLDSLSISSVRVITLADSKVASSRLSGYQCYLKLGFDLFVFIVVPICLLIGMSIVLFNMWMNKELHQDVPWWFFSSRAFGLSIAALGPGIVLYGLARFVGNVRRILFLGTGVVKLDAGRTESFIGVENKRTRSGRGDSFFSGKAVLRIGDADWEKAVETAIRNVNFIIFDATDYSDNLLWELKTVVRLGCVEKLVIVSEKEEVAARFQSYFELNGIDWHARLVPYGGFSDSLVDRRRICKIMEKKIHSLAADLKRAPQTESFLRAIS